MPRVTGVTNRSLKKLLKTSDDGYVIDAVEIVTDYCGRFPEHKGHVEFFFREEMFAKYNVFKHTTGRLSELGIQYMVPNHGLRCIDSNQIFLTNVEYEKLIHLSSAETADDIRYEFFDMVITVTSNNEPSTLRWSEHTVARVVCRMTHPTTKYMIQWQPSPHHGYRSAWVSSADIRPHIDCAHTEPLPPGEAAKRCMATFVTP